MNMILDTKLTVPEAMLMIICLGFIFGMFYYVGETMFDELENNEEDGTE